MSDLPNGGKESQIDNTAIQDVYRYIRERTECTWLPFRRSVVAYGATGTTRQYVYEAKVIDYTVDGQTRQFHLPKISYIGYTDQEMKWLDDFYGSLVRKLQSGDLTFINSPAMQELANAVAGQRDIFSLRAPDGIPGGATPGGAKGIGPTSGADGDNQQETVIFAEDLHGQKRDRVINESRLRAEFVSRAFHELLHRNWVHNRYAYDTTAGGGSLGAALVANVENGFDIADMRALDKVYLETRNALTTLSADPQSGLSASVVDDVFKDGTQAALRSALSYRTQRIFANTKAALSNSAVDFTPEQLKVLRDEDIIQLKRAPDDVDTPEEKEAWRNNEANYEMDPAFIRKQPPEQQADCANVNYESVREGAFESVGEAVDAALSFAEGFFAEYSSEIGQALGSNLGTYIARNESQGVQIGVSTLLGVIGQNLGESIELYLLGASADVSLQVAFKDLPTDLKNAGLGVISSLLTAELFDSLGIDGTAGELGQSVFSSYLTTVIQNLPALINGTETLTNVLQGVQVGNIIGGFIGTKLASKLVQFDTIGGQIGSAVGSSVGAIVGGMTALESAAMGAKFGSFAGPIGAAIGAFVGFILGGLIGSLFGGTPRSGANLAFDHSKQQFKVTSAWAKNGATKDGARSIATGAANLVNSVIALTGARVTDAHGV